VGFGTTAANVIVPKSYITGLEVSLPRFPHPQSDGNSFEMDPYYYKPPRAGKGPNVEVVLSKQNEYTTNHGSVTNSYDYSSHSTRFENFTNNGHYIGTNTGATNHYSSPHDVADM